MARMSKEAYLRQMERVNDPYRSERSYRAPPPVWEKPWDYLTTDKKISEIAWKVIGYGFLALATIGIGSCVYKVYNTVNSQSNQRQNPQVLVQPAQEIINPRRAQRLNLLEKKVKAFEAANPITKPAYKTRNNQQLPNKNDAYQRFYTQSK